MPTSKNRRKGVTRPRSSGSSISAAGAPYAVDIDIPLGNFGPEPIIPLHRDARAARQQASVDHPRVPSALSNLIRHTCSVCGSHNIRWLEPAAAAPFMPGLAPAAAQDAWLCLECSAGGTFGDPAAGGIPEWVLTDEAKDS